MAASDYVPIFFKNRLHLAGRPQMGTRPSKQARLRGRYDAGKVAQPSIRRVV